MSPGDPLENPYAPPKTETAVRLGHPESIQLGSTYEAERRSVPLLVFFSVITLGVYPAIWFFRRRRFLDSLDSTDKLGALAGGPLVATVIAFGLGLLDLPPEVDRAVSVGLGSVTIVAAFRVARILRSNFTRTGRFLRVSSAGTFFFNALYLQYKINQAADTLPREPIPTAMEPSTGPKAVDES